MIHLNLFCGDEKFDLERFKKEKKKTQNKTYITYVA
jgi:hypothetical protein